MPLVHVVSASIGTSEYWARTQELQIPVDASNCTLKRKKSDFLMCNLF